MAAGDGGGCIVGGDGGLYGGMGWCNRKRLLVSKTRTQALLLSVEELMIRLPKYGLKPSKYCFFPKQIRSLCGL